MITDLVSIITPTYNCGNFISETIRSVQSQSYQNWEMIIIDDCSNDNTDGVVADFLDDTRIKYIKNSVNSGAAVSRNRAINLAQGKWIAFLDSDDLWDTHKLEKQLQFMISNQVDFSYTKYEEIDESSHRCGVIVGGPKKITKVGMYAYCWPGCLTIMYNRDKVGLVQINDIKKNNDYAMWLKIVQKADCYLLDEVLAYYRKRTGSISNHSYSKLIQWHYKLFKEVDARSSFQSCILTFGNLFFGIVKKIWYVKRSRD